MNDTITEIPKNSREKLVFTLAEYRGKLFLDIRTHVNPDNGGQPIATKKGVTIPPALYPQFRAALAQVEQAMVEQGWLDKEDLQGEF